jgi:hypothetical protein
MAESQAAWVRVAISRISGSATTLNERPSASRAVLAGIDWRQFLLVVARRWSCDKVLFLNGRSTLFRTMILARLPQGSRPCTGKVISDIFSVRQGGEQRKGAWQENREADQ